MKPIPTAIALIMLAAGPAALGAEKGTVWLDDAALTSTFNGKTVVGRYENGRPFTEVYTSDGEARLNERGLLTSGRWSVTSGTFCTIYDTDPSGGCFRVMRTSDNCYEFYFVARTEEQATEGREGPPDWTAQGSIVGRPSTCADGASV